MKQQQFQKIALIGREGIPGVVETLAALIACLCDNRRDVVLERSTAKFLGNQEIPTVDAGELRQHADLVIVVGGDGSLLNAAQIAIENDLPVLGINRGRLGFLTDIHPNQLEQINTILSGNYKRETRFLLQATLQKITISALNDVVLLPGDVAQMIKFDLFVNEQFVCRHHADGMIIATPTGSTAYALSGGGPILHPGLAAIVMVPMFPHTLSSRPIVIDSNSKIRIQISETNEVSPYLSCDGQKRIAIKPGEQVTIQKQDKQLQLIHPMDYSYFHTLREKLNWEKQAKRKC